MVKESYVILVQWVLFVPFVVNGDLSLSLSKYYSIKKHLVVRANIHFHQMLRMGTLIHFVRLQEKIFKNRFVSVIEQILWAYPLVVK